MSTPAKPRRTEAIPGHDAQYEAAVKAAADSLPTLTPEDAAAIGVLIGPVPQLGQNASAA